jgi:hypothetical protein
MTFSSLMQALHAGFQVYYQTDYGYVVHSKTSAGRVLAIVNLDPTGSVQTR